MRLVSQYRKGSIKSSSQEKRVPRLYANPPSIKGKVQNIPDNLKETKIINKLLKLS